ncbi:MAG: methionyl-tRNA formyltransferase [Candidatus Nealsonbacteria bacterium]|nr:MAG: methionyl-tRNA formyltransferase [Candidatus Nealsonbacteria bacterium]
MNHESKIKVIFIGTPEFGAIILEKLVKTPYKPILVITAPDKPKGRKQILTPPPVKVIAQKYSIPIEQPNKIRDCKLKIENLKPDLGIVAAYGQILPKTILDIPKYGFLNVHPSLLPRWRGSSPIQYTILNGDKKTGVTIILMNEKMDEGPIIATSNLKSQISNLTYEELSEKLANLGAELLIKTIPKWIAGEIKPKPQDHSKATYTKILKKEDGKIDWSKSAHEIEREIRAFYPWPGSFCSWDGKRMKVLKAEVLKCTKTCPKGVLGKTFLAPDDKIAVQTGKDFLVITELQLEGKKPTNSKDFLNGHPDFIGTILK